MDLLFLVYEKLLKLDFDRTGGEATPIDLPLSQDAKAVWQAFRVENEALRYSTQNDAIRGAVAKMDRYAARLALVIHCVRSALPDTHIDPNVIDAESFKAGVELAKWFRQEATRIYTILGIGDDDVQDDLQADLTGLIWGLGGKITVRELMHACVRYRKSAKVTRAALQELVDRGRGRWVPPDRGGKPGRPSDCFELYQQFADEAGNSNKTPPIQMECGNGNETPLGP